MKKSLISEWTKNDEWYQLFMGEKDDGNPLIILQSNQTECAAKIQFWGNEGMQIIEGITETLITSFDELHEDLLVGLVLSDRGELLFGWSPYISERVPYLVVKQGRWQVSISKDESVEFLRWLRRNLQLIERLVS